MAAWSPTQIYLAGESVTYGGSTWTSTQNYNYNNAPVLGSVWWSGGGGSGGGVTALALDSIYPGALRIATTNGGPPVLPGALTTGNVYVGATTSASGIAVDTTYGNGVLRLAATDGGSAVAPGTVVNPGYLGFLLGGSLDLPGGDFALFAPPAAGSTGSAQVTAIPQANVVAGRAYLITWSVNVVNADSPGGTPHPVQWDTGTDYIEVSISGACLSLQDCITEATVAAFVNRPGIAPQLSDTYSGVLFAQTDGTAIPSDIDIKVSVANRSGTVNYGSFTSFGAQISPLMLTV